MNPTNIPGYRCSTPEPQEPQHSSHFEIKWAPKIISMEYGQLQHKIIAPREAYQKAHEENNEALKDQYLRVMQAYQDRMTQIEKYCAANGWVIG